MISGDPDGSHPWTTVAQATWLGKPDSAGTTVVYLLSKPFPCDSTSWGGGTGWDAKVPAGTLMIEFKIAPPSPTTFPTMYAVPLTNPVLAQPPPAGKAFAIWNSLTATPPIAEASASGTSLTVTALNANTDVKGTFNLTFGGGHTLTGSFDAQYCAGAGEP